MIEERIPPIIALDELYGKNKDLEKIQVAQRDADVRFHAHQIVVLLESIERHLVESPSCSYKYCFSDKFWQVLKQQALSEAKEGE